MEIEKKLVSVVNYPERGPWGNSKFRGNCPGYLVKDLIEFYKPSSVLDPMCGSGTVGDVCEELGIPCDSFDLRDGFDLLTSSLPAKRYDMIFMHPPYWNITKYSNDPRDLSNAKRFGDFMERLFRCIERLGEYLSENGVFVILIGDVRKKGQYYPLGAYIQVFYRKELRDKLIKIQQKITSARTPYRGKFVRIIHEEVLVLRSFRRITWKELVTRTLRELGGQATLPQMYRAIAKHPKRLTNPTFDATIRRTLQENAVHLERGIWGNAN